MRSHAVDGSKFGLLVVLRGLGGPGAITNRRGMKKYPGGLIFMGFGWNYEGFNSDSCSKINHLVMQIPRVLSNFQQTFEPVTPPLKWV